MAKNASDELGDLKAFSTVARAGGFREAARIMQVSASGLSAAVRRLENRLQVRLLHRTTRNVLLTEQGKRLLDDIGPSIAQLDKALKRVSSSRDIPAGTLRLNTPVNTARLWLPNILPAFIRQYPDINVEVIAQTGVVDLLSAGCDAGIRYGEWLEQDMIAIPVGPREQRFATAVSPDFIKQFDTPQHPYDLLSLPCIRGRFAKGNLEKWVYQQGEEIISIEPEGPIIYSAGTAMDLGVEAALSGLGAIHLFEEWLAPYFAKGALVPVLKPWWQDFQGPYLYYSGRKLVPPPLRAFIEYIKGAAS